MSLHIIHLGSSSKRTLPSCLCLACLSTITKSQVLIQTLLLSASSKTITFYNKDTRGEIQKATFNQEQVKRVFHGSFHKVRALCACHIMMLFRFRPVTCIGFKSAHFFRDLTIPALHLKKAALLSG